MSDINLEHLEQLEQAATPGPWVPLGFGLTEAEKTWYPKTQTQPPEWVDTKADAELIVAANALPELLKRVRFLEETVIPQWKDEENQWRSENEQLRIANAELVQQNELLRQPYESYTEDGEAVLPRGWVAVDGGRLDELEADSAETERLRTANAELVEALRPFAEAWKAVKYDGAHLTVGGYIASKAYEHAAEVVREHGGEDNG